jgi:hypothetical protein
MKSEYPPQSKKKKNKKLRRGAVNRKIIPKIPIVENYFALYAKIEENIDEASLFLEKTKNS